MRILVCLLTIASLLSCKGSDKRSALREVDSRYALDTTWPRLENGLAFGQPTGIGIDTQGHIFVFHRAGRRWSEPFPDSTISRNTVFELDAAGKLVNAWGANTFIMPHGLTVDHENNIWLTDVALHQVFKFSHNGELLMTLGIAKTPANDPLHFNLPTDVAVARDGSFYVSDGYGNSRVVKFSPEGKFLKTWGTYGKNPGEFVIPHGIAIGPDNLLYVADRQNNRVQVFDTSGKFLKLIRNDADVEQVPSLAFSPAGSLFVID